ncbi:MAG: ABC transporter ATP-binding protein [Bacillota bacterium]
MPNAIEVSGLEKRFEKVPALCGLDFEVRTGEIFGLLGPNGAGKTTTIRILTGLARPSAGSALILGLDSARHMRAIKKRIGVVPDVSNLYGELSAVNNLRFVAALYGVPRAERAARAHGLLKTFQLADRADSPFRTLSRGMKRRVTIAAAMIHRPEILFLDEPTAGLDVGNARALRGVIAALRTQGTTVFLTTHNLEEANSLCDRVAIIHSGRILTIQTPQDLRAAALERPVLEVTVSGSAEVVAAAVRALPGVSALAVRGPTLRVETDNLPLVLPRLVEALDEAGLAVQEINTVKPTLEDAFVRLTSPGGREGRMGEVTIGA